MEEEKEKPNCYGCIFRQSIQDCYGCIFRQSIPENTHSMCGNPQAKVIVDKHVIKNGWFWFPFNFDPIWLKSCIGFKSKEETK